MADGCHPPPSAGARDRTGRRQPRPGDGIDRHLLRRATALCDGCRSPSSARPRRSCTPSRRRPAGTEWELVRVRGTVVDVRRYGQAWRAELRLADGTKVPDRRPGAGEHRGRVDHRRPGVGRSRASSDAPTRAPPRIADHRLVLPRSADPISTLALRPPTAGQAGGATHPTGAVGSSTGAASSPSGPPSTGRVCDRRGGRRAGQCRPTSSTSVGS